MAKLFPPAKEFVDTEILCVEYGNPTISNLSAQPGLLAWWLKNAILTLPLPYSTPFFRVPPCNMSAGITPNALLFSTYTALSRLSFRAFTMQAAFTAHSDPSIFFSLSLLIVKLTIPSTKETNHVFLHDWYLLNLLLGK